MAGSEVGNEQHLLAYQLFRLIVLCDAADDGLENRTIVSSIAQHYKPEELVGKQVLFIANLAPRQFKNGLVSEGMILSAENYDGSLAVTSLLKEVKPGSEVK